jgi:predicted RNA-binding protein with RPS1 domain
MSKLSVEERELLTAAYKYAVKNEIPLTKVSWALSSVIDRPDNAIYHKLKGLDGEVEVELDQVPDRTEYKEVEAPLEDRLGEVVKVEAVSVRTYGVVCAVEGTTRTLLLHISEVANEFIQDLAEYVEQGDKFNAMLIVNPQEELGLSTRRVAPLTQKRTITRQTADKEG